MCFVLGGLIVAWASVLTLFEYIHLSRCERGEAQDFLGAAAGKQYNNLTRTFCFSVSRAITFAMVINDVYICFLVCV